MSRKKPKGASKGASSTVSRLPVGPAWRMALRPVDQPFEDAPDGLMVVLWAVDDGRMAGIEPMEQGPDLHRRIAQATLRVMREPMVGSPHRPRVLHVPDPDLASVLRSALAGAVRVVDEAPPEELERMADALVRELVAAAEPLVSSDELHAALRVAMRLYPTAPWDDAKEPLVLRSHHEELDGRVVTLMGADAGDTGLMLLQDEQELLRLMEATAMGNKPSGRVLTLRYMPGDREDRAMIAGLGLSVGPSGEIPYFARLEDGEPTPTTPDDLAVMSTVMEALAQVFEGLEQEWPPEDGYVGLAEVQHRGESIEVEVELALGEDDDEEPQSEVDRLNVEVLRLHLWLRELLDEIELHIHLDAAAADPSWIERLPASFRGEATRLLERLALARRHLEAAEREEAERDAELDDDESDDDEGDGDAPF
jgi:hypothetical protein